MATKLPMSIDRSSIPTLFPTQAHAPAFWEQLGRTIATFGFLEQTLGKAIFAITLTQTVTEAEAEAVEKKLTKVFGKALSDTLKPLADSYGKAVRDNQASVVQDVDALVEKIKAAADIRDILCHASWDLPDFEGKALPFFTNKKIEVVETKMDIAFLRQTQEHVVEIFCDVIESVTKMGYQFPGEEDPVNAFGLVAWMQIDPYKRCCVD